MLTASDHTELVRLRLLVAKREGAPGFAANVKFLKENIAILEAKQAGVALDDPSDATA